MPTQPEISSQQAVQSSMGAFGSPKSAFTANTSFAEAQRGSFMSSSPSPLQQTPEDVQKDRNKPRARFPREQQIKNTKSVNGGKSPNSTKTKSKRSIKKKKKFHLIPTFKHLENGRFIGRQSSLKYLRQLVIKNTPYASKSLKDSMNQSASAVQAFNKLSVTAITGSTGIGKSSLAYLYLLGYESRYKYVFWINANNILSDVRDILLYHLHNPLEVQAMKTETKSEILKLRFLHFLTCLESNWLVVFDDFNDTNINIQEWIPQKLENLEVNKLHKFMMGHVIISTALPGSFIRRKFSSFKTKIGCLKLNYLPPEESKDLLLKYSSRSSEHTSSETDSSVLENILDRDHLHGEPLPIVLFSNLARHTSANFSQLLRRFEEQAAFLDNIKDKTLEGQFLAQKNADKRTAAASTMSQRNVFTTFMKKWKARRPDSKSPNASINQSFHPKLFELELFLKQHSLERYLELLVTKGVLSIDDLASVHSWWPSVKREIFAKDLERFEQVALAAQNALSQRRVTICIKMWTDFLGYKVENLTGSEQVTIDQTLSCLRQFSWLSSKRIPLFLFPELCLENQHCFEMLFNSFLPMVPNKESESFSDTQSQSGSSFSTVTHNTNALSYMDLKLLGSFRINNTEVPSSMTLLNLKFDNDVLSRPTIFAFLLRNNLIKMEKIGFFSINSQIQTALSSLEVTNSGGVSSINVILEKFHHLSFELNFENLYGENLEYLLTNPDSVENDSKLVDLKDNIKHFRASRSEHSMKSYITKNFSLKLNLLPHFNALRLKVANELENNTLFQSKLKKSWSDEEGILRFKKISEKLRDKLSNMHSDGQKRFNATISPLFPNFHEREIELILSDLTFNEGIILLDIPFRSTRYADALSCFNASAQGYEFVLSRNHAKVDLVLPRAHFFVGMCHFKLKSLTASLTAFRQSLKHYQRLHGEYTNHVDIARVFSSIGCVYNELYKKHRDLLIGNIGEKETWSNQQATRLDQYSLEGLKYHDLSIRIYEDLYVNSGSSRNYTRSLLNKGRSLLVLEQPEGEALVIKSITLLEQMDASCGLPLNYAKIGAASLLLCKFYAKKTNDKKQLRNFLKYLNKALFSYSQLFRVENNELELHERHRKLTEGSETKVKEWTNFVDMKLIDIPPHNLVIDALLSAAYSLQPYKPQVSTALFQAAHIKLRELFGDFSHPKSLALEGLNSG